MARRVTHINLCPLPPQRYLPAPTTTLTATSTQNHQLLHLQPPTSGAASRWVRIAHGLDARALPPQVKSSSWCAGQGLHHLSFMISILRPERTLSPCGRDRMRARVMERVSLKPGPSPGAQVLPILLLVVLLWVLFLVHTALWCQEGLTPGCDGTSPPGPGKDIKRAARSAGYHTSRLAEAEGAEATS
jgi:hypothetical protein